MKLQNLAVVFIVIILPIAIVLSVYTGNLIDVANKQAEYDSILLDSTYDAVRAYQMNTLNNDFESATNSKVRDINASINSFFNSLASSLNSSGSGKQELTEYIPALLYTLYDGYYVYGTYNNVADVSDGIKYSTEVNVGNKQYGIKPYIYYSCEYADPLGNYDLIVNYTLDNYITVTGTYKDSNGIMTNIAQSGYYINYNNIYVSQGINGPASFNDKIVRLYTAQDNEVIIKPEKLGEYLTSYDTKITIENNNTKYNYVLSTPNGEAKYYNYIIYNNVKYYLDVDHVNAEVVRNGSNNLSFNMTYDGYPIFFLDGDKRTYVSKSTFEELKSFLGVGQDSDMYSSEEGVGCFRDVNAYNYYYKSVMFSKTVRPALELIDLGTTEITDENGNNIRVIASNIPYDSNGNLHPNNVIKTETYHTNYTSTNNVSSHTKSTYDNSKVFQLDEKGENDPELESSSFNRHRIDVIISSIESSLVSTIGNFNNYIGGTYEYSMPILTEEEWNRISNNVTIVSFMQGLTIGNYKYYSSYSIVANTKVKDFISRDSIYVQNSDVSSSRSEEYHNPRCEDYNSMINEQGDAKLVGYRNIDYDRKNCILPSEKGDDGKEYFYYLQQQMPSYQCVVSLNDNIYTTDEIIKGKILSGEIKNPINPEIRRAYITALAREKGNSYKTYGFLNEELQIRTSLSQGEASYTVHYFYQDYDFDSNVGKNTYTEVGNSYTYASLIGTNITSLNINRTPNTGYKYLGDSQIKVYDYTQDKYVLLNNDNNKLKENTRTDVALFFDIDLNQSKTIFYDVEYYLWNTNSAKYDFIERIRTQSRQWVNGSNSFNVNLPSTYRGASIVYTDPEDYINARKNITSGGVIKAYYSTQPEWTGKDYVVRYHPNGGIGSMENNTYKFYERNTLSPNTFTKEGSKFSGWALNSNADVIYVDADTITKIDGSNMTKENDVYYLDLYAKWAGITYQVNYQPNGATSGEMQNSTHAFNERSKLSKNQFKKEHNIILDIGPGQTNFYNNGTFSSWLNSANISFDNNTNEFSMTVNSATAKGSGLYYTDKNAILKSGKTATISYEVYSNRKVTLGLKVQNSIVGKPYSNDRVDGYSDPDLIEIPANEWTTIYFSYKNNNNSSIYDYSVLYVEDSNTPVNLKIKNPRFEVINGKVKVENNREIITIEDTFLNWTYQGNNYQDEQEIYNLTDKDGEVVSITAKWDKTQFYLPEINSNGYKFKGWVGPDGKELDPDDPIEIEDGENPIITAEWEDDQPPTVNISVINTTSSSITTTTTATDEGAGLKPVLYYTYFIKEKGTPENMWQQFDGYSESEYTFYNLKQNTSYDIRVIVREDFAGNSGTATTIGTTRNITGKIFVKSQSWYVTENDEGRQVVEFGASDLSDNSMYIETRLETTNEWTKSDIVYDVAHGQTVYARLTDGNNYIANTSVKVIDNIKPQIILQVPYYTEIEMAATDEGAGIVGYVVTTTPQTPAQNAFTRCNTTHNLFITLTGLSENTLYYLWVIDGAGNISNYSTATTLQQIYSVYYNIDVNNVKKVRLKVGEDCLKLSFETPTKNGYTFVGWKTTKTADEIVLNNKIVINEDIYLYAVFKKNITLTYYNNNTRPETAVGEQYYNNGIVRNPVFTINQANRNGWQARGWSIYQDGNAGITYNNIINREFNTNVTVYGLYQKLVTLSYNGNGNTSGTTTPSTAMAYYNSSGRTVDATISLKQNGFLRNNCTWLGWAEGSIGGTIRNPGYIYSGINDITYWAKWKERIYLKGNINVSATYVGWFKQGYFWDINGGASEPSKPGYGYRINTPVNYAGYNWEGAYKDILLFQYSYGNNGSNCIIPLRDVTGNGDYLASWYGAFDEQGNEGNGTFKLWRDQIY